MDIVTLGELLVDMFPAELGRRLAEVTAFHPKPGGAPANVAVAAAKLGAAAAFVGKVGDDAFGHHLIEVLKNEGVETRAMRLDAEARTTMAFIAKPDAHTAEFVFYRNPGADTRLRPEELDRALLQDARAFLFGSVSLTHEPTRSALLEAVRIARAAGALVGYDVNYRPSLWRVPQEAFDWAMKMIPQVHLVKVNEVELALLSGEKEIDLSAGAEGALPQIEAAAKALLAHGPELVVVTLGRHGSYFQIGAGGAYLPPFPVETVDAVGCGDAFIAALLTRLVLGVARGAWRSRLTVDDLREALRYANAAGALTATIEGTIPALPTAGQVEAFLAQHP
ncbi:MAG: carbohydrate kinase [Anaerolineae bacterium]